MVFYVIFNNDLGTSSTVACKMANLMDKCVFWLLQTHTFLISFLIKIFQSQYVHRTIEIKPVAKPRVGLNFEAMRTITPLSLIQEIVAIYLNEEGIPQAKNIPKLHHLCQRISQCYPIYIDKWKTKWTALLKGSHHGLIQPDRNTSWKKFNQSSSYFKKSPLLP